jgi:LPS export ABC transporter protein LptC
VFTNIDLRVVTSWAFAGLALLALGACEREETAPVIASDLVAMEADNVLYSMTHYMTRDGLREALVEADTAYSWQDSTRVDMRNVRLVVYGDAGEEKAVVTARNGYLDPETRQMFAQGEVVLTIFDGDRIVESEELNYNPDQDRIWSDMPTVMREGNQVLEGTGFDSDTQFQNLRVRNARTRGGIRF